MAKQRIRIPSKLEAELLAADNHTCCICHEPRKHVQIHHIDSDPSNNDRDNLAVVCTDCHSRVTGDEGMGRRFSAREVGLYKKRWELECINQGEDDGEEEPITTDVREFVVRPASHRAFQYELAEGQLLLASVEADVPVNVMLASARKYARWDADEEISLDEFVDDHLRTQVEFIAPRDRTYVLWIENTDDDNQATVGLDVSVWDAEEEDQEEDEAENDDDEDEDEDED